MPSLSLHTDNLLAGKLIPPFRGGLPAIVLSSAAQLMGIIQGEAERGSGVGLKLFGFIAEPLFAFIGILFETIPEHRSASSRNRVQLAPDSQHGQPLFQG